MNERVKKELENRFGERARFDRNERLVYSRDVGNLPDVVEMMLDNLADAVVQPENLDDLVFLAKLATREGLPVVPRGAATSGYGGSVPAKAGVVVAFRRMNHVLSFDRGNLTVTVEPGVIWANLEKALKPEGLALRLYPTSAPAPPSAAGSPRAARASALTNSVSSLTTSSRSSWSPRPARSGR